MEGLIRPPSELRRKAVKQTQVVYQSVSHPDRERAQETGTQQAFHIKRLVLFFNLTTVNKFSDWLSVCKSTQPNPPTLPAFKIKDLWADTLQTHIKSFSVGVTDMNIKMADSRAPQVET